MRSAPLGFLAIVMIGCGGNPTPRADPTTEAASPGTATVQASRLVGEWQLVPYPRRNARLVLDLRVDSVVVDSVFGALLRYFQGDAGLWRASDWGPLGGNLRSDTVVLVVQPGHRTPEFTFHGALKGDTITLTVARLGTTELSGGWVLLRSR